MKITDGSHTACGEGRDAHFKVENVLNSQNTLSGPTLGCWYAGSCISR